MSRPGAKGKPRQPTRKQQIVSALVAGGLIIGSKAYKEHRTHDGPCCTERTQDQPR